MSGPQQPPVRPWFRLASMVRPADPRPPPPPPSPITATIEASPISPKKPPPAPASPPSATATPKVGMDSSILTTSTRNTPQVEPRSPIVSINPPPIATTLMSPGVPRLPTTVPQPTTSPAPNLRERSTSAPTPPLSAVPDVLSPKLIVNNNNLSAAADQEHRTKTSTDTLSTTTPPPQSPYKPKDMAPPPSPLVLPPPQISAMISTNNEPMMIPPEAEQKTVLVQEDQTTKATLATYPAAATQTSSLQQLNKNNNNSVDAAATRTNGAIAAHHHPATYKEGEADKIITTNKNTSRLNKKKLESDLEVGMKVITIAGENRGAIMELVRSPPQGSGKSVGRYTGRHNNKVMSGNERESYSSGSGNGEEAGTKKYNKSNKEKLNSLSSSIPMTAFMNSNVQGVNNSIFFNAQCSHNDPGVHVSISRKPPSASANANVKSNAHNGKG